MKPESTAWIIACCPWWWKLCCWDSRERPGNLFSTSLRGQMQMKQHWKKWHIGSINKSSLKCKMFSFYQIKALGSWLTQFKNVFWLKTNSFKCYKLQNFCWLVQCFIFCSSVMPENTENQSLFFLDFFCISTIRKKCLFIVWYIYIGNIMLSFKPINPFIRLNHKWFLHGLKKTCKQSYFSYQSVVGDSSPYIQSIFYLITMAMTLY